MLWFVDGAVVSVWWRGFSLRVGIYQRSEWVWGYEEGWWDGPTPAVGCGPLGYVSWLWSFREALSEVA